MADGGINCPVTDCKCKLAFQESADAPTINISGGSISVPIERNFYRCEKHGLFRYHGDGKFSPVEKA